MNREVLITLIGCAIIFAGVGFFAYSMNIDDMNKPEKNFSDSTQNIKINDNTSIKKSTAVLKIPANNTIPWGTITGTVTNPAVGHPVIIQFFKSLDDSPVHVAQVNLNDDNTFEYRFRVFSIDDGITTHFFSGDYFIKVFSTVNTQPDK